MVRSAIIDPNNSFECNEITLNNMTKLGKVDEYGFERPDDFNYEIYGSFTSEYLRVLTHRAQRWSTIKDEDLWKKSKKLKRFIRKGVPSTRRLKVWMIVSGAEKLKRESKFSYIQLKKNFDNRNIMETIKIDLPRTFPENIFFNKDENLYRMLFNILAAFAHQNTEVGYCQGLNYIAALLLLAVKDEEAAFWLLKILVERILPKYYISTMSGLITDLDVLDELIKNNEPIVHRHIHTIGMPWAMGVTKWFVCLYAEVLPTETVLRIWDCLFYEGSKILFRVGIALIKIHRDDILKTIELGELTVCFKNFKCSQRVIYCHQFMKDVFVLSGNLSISTIQKLRLKHKKEEK